MKKIPVIAVVLSAMMLLNSCAVNKSTTEPGQTLPEISGEPSAACFVQLNDGAIRQFKTLKLVTGVLTTPHLLGDGLVVVNAKDITAYQDTKIYAVSSKLLTGKKNSMVSVDALPGFAVKVLSGKINLYSRKYYNGTNISEEYFVQNGNDGFIVSCTKEVLKTMLKDDINALSFFNSKTKELSKSKKLLAAIEIYNKGQMMTKN